MHEHINSPGDYSGELRQLREENARLRAMLKLQGDSKTEEALRQSEKRFRLILENMPILLNAFDDKGNIIVWNKACEQSTGYSADEIIGNPQAMELLYPDPDYRKKVIQMSDHPNANQNTFELTTKNGGKRTITWFDTYHYVEIPGWASWGLGLDVTDRIKAEEALIEAKERAEESDRLKTAFINNISHEIRTPLNSILGLGQFLAEPGRSQQERHENFEFLKNSSNRLLQTINDIMDVSLITAKSIKVNKQSFDLLALLNDLLIKFRRKASTKNILVNMEVPAGEKNLSLLTDKELLTKVFDHLLGNAEKFTENGRITFGYQHSANDLEFFIKDTGKGIAVDKQTIVFEAFAQEDPSNTRGYEGSGLGLTIAKGLVTLLGGQIWLYSKPGEGSTFWFTLPNTAVTKESTTEQIIVSNISDQKKHLILIAEDDDANYHYTNAVLNLAGFSSLHALNGLEAVTMCQDYPEIALVLMDIKMPLMNGIKATEIIKSQRPDLPVIALTAHAQTGDKSRIMAAGCDAYITKPVTKKTLETIINKYIQIC